MTDLATVVHGGAIIAGKGTIIVHGRATVVHEGAIIAPEGAALVHEGAALVHEGAALEHEGAAFGQGMSENSCNWTKVATDRATFAQWLRSSARSGCSPVRPLRPCGADLVSGEGE